MNDPSHSRSPTQLPATARTRILLSRIARTGVPALATVPLWVIVQIGTGGRTMSAANRTVPTVLRESFVLQVRCSWRCGFSRAGASVAGTHSGAKVPL